MRILNVAGAGADAGEWRSVFPEVKSWEFD